MPSNILMCAMVIISMNVHGQTSVLPGFQNHLNYQFPCSTLLEQVKGREVILSCILFQFWGSQPLKTREDSVLRQHVVLSPKALLALAEIPEQRNETGSSPRERNHRVTLYLWVLEAFPLSSKGGKWDKNRLSVRFIIHSGQLRK